VSGPALLLLLSSCPPTGAAPAAAAAASTCVGRPHSCSSDSTSSSNAAHCGSSAAAAAMVELAIVGDSVTEAAAGSRMQLESCQAGEAPKRISDATAAAEAQPSYRVEEPNIGLQVYL